MNHTDVQVGCLRYQEIIINLNLFVSIYFHILQKTVIFPPQFPSADEEKFFSKMGLIPQTAAFMHCRYEMGRLWLWPSKGYREIEDNLWPLHKGDYRTSQTTNQPAGRLPIFNAPKTWCELFLHHWPGQPISLSIGLLTQPKYGDNNTFFTILLGLSEILHVKYLANHIHTILLLISITP